MHTAQHSFSFRWTMSFLGVIFLTLTYPAWQEEALSRSPTTRPSTVLHVTLNDFTIHLNTATIPSGLITFEAMNAGTQIHELVVLRTDRAPNNLVQIHKPKETTGGEGGLMVNERDPAVEPIDEIEEFPPGSRAVKHLDLPPGRYVLLCNIPNHYQKGMFTSLHVTE